jgi:hypothetical protein
MRRVVHAEARECQNVFRTLSNAGVPEPARDWRTQAVMGMDPLLAYLPQYESEVTGTVVAVWAVGWGLFYFAKGSARELARFRPRTVRALAGGQILLGIGVGVFSFEVNSEPPCGGCGQDHWGGTTGLAELGIWLALVAAIAAFVFIKRRKN